MGLEEHPPTESRLKSSDDVERAFLRLVMADDDEKLQRFTDGYLPDLLLLAGRQATLVSQITELLTHYNKRVKTNVAIAFPVEVLIGLLLSSNSVTSNLSLVYLKYARDRLPANVQVSLIPLLIDAINKKADDISISFDLSALCMPGLRQICNMDREKWPLFELSSAGVHAFTRIFRCILAFQATNVIEIQEKVKALASTEQQTAVHCAGLSPQEYLLVASKFVGETLALTELKVAIISLLSHGFIGEKMAFPLLVLASAANVNAVDDAAESALKKVDIQLLVDDVTIVKDLMFMYLGSAADSKKPDNFMRMAQPGSIAMKQRILPFLTRSKIAATTYMNNVKICLDGMSSEVTRTQISALTFLHAVIEKMPPTALKTLGPSLFARLRKLLGQSTKSSAALCWVYRCLSVLGKMHPALVFEDVEIVGEMLQEIPKEEEDVGYAIVDCLVSWLPAFCQAAAQQSEKTSLILREFIAAHVAHENAKCRLVALKYIEALINENEMELKWMLLKTAGDNRDEMRQEATRLLDLSLHRAVPAIPLVVVDLWTRLENDIEDNDGLEKLSSKQAYSNLIHEACSKYVWAVVETLATGRAAGMRIVEGDDHWEQVAPLIVKQLKSLNDPRVTELAVKMALYAVRDSIDVHQFRIAACFVSALGPSVPIATIFPVALTTCLQRLRASTRIDLSLTITFLSSLMMGRNTKLRSDTYLSATNELDTKHTIAGLCWTAAATVCFVQDPSRPPISQPELGTKVATAFVDRLIRYISDGYERPCSILEASLGALGFILKTHSSRTMRLELSPEKREKILEFCEKIATSRKDSLSQRAREASARVMGWIVDDISDEETFEKSLRRVFAIGEGPPQPELQLSAGEGLIDVALGPYSPSRRQPYLVADDDVTISSIGDPETMNVVEKRLGAILLTLIDEKLTSANHHLRRAALVWLLVVVQKSAKLGLRALREDRLFLSRIQNAFADGLTENDDYTQDVASKGLGAVYAMADAELRKELVNSLMGALTEGRRTERKVAADTVVFAGENQIGKSPTGENLTTYKELCSLATDLNQPDLVYKFMQLAKHNATWNSKKGAAFGFGAVLEQAREELSPYLGQLVPKLFRYRYDPDSKVQKSMRSIWSVLTQQRRNVIDEFADEICRELIPALTNKEWRVRESACLALSDLLRGHDTPFMHSKIPDLLETVLRVRDDIKESVRLAADTAAESIKRIISKLATSSNSNDFLSIVLPLIIGQAVNATVKSNKAFCLSMLLELSKTAGRQLTPYLDALIPTLLDAISENESSLLNYIAARSDSNQLEALDDARGHMARTSPMMTAIHDLLPHINDDVLTKMAPRVCDQLRTSVGVSTRSAAAQLITQLVLRAPQLLMSHKAQCDKFFHALVPGVRDRNPSIRKQFANTLSYLAKYVSHQQMSAMMEKITKDLLGDDEDLKQSAKHLLKNLAANCSELLGGYSTQIVPYVFLETCQEVVKGDDESKRRRDDWAELWSELVPSTSAAARLYQKEIVSTGLDVVKNNEVWSVRAQAARMISQVAEALGDNLDIKMADEIFDTLLPTLSGRIWTGKNELLNAFSATISAVGEEYKKSMSESRRKEISQVLQREASKRNVDYASAGLRSVATYAASVGDVDAARWLAQQVQANVDKATRSSQENVQGSDSDDAMSGLSNLEKEIRVSQIVSSNIVALATSIRAFDDGGDARESMEKLRNFLLNTSVTWKSKQTMLAELLKTVERWEPRPTFDATDLVSTLSSFADEMINQQKRTVAAEALQVVMKLIDRPSWFAIDRETVGELLTTSRAALETGYAARFSQLPDFNSPMEVD
ncbi:unnamed protein product [Caenorhabditis auriculariae]|uniref:Uncharacterized protein n=1 Tax=Caenorhabditis auriculariae TaxID=2777116 RepID=A0A8S1GR10_9PELO|nr:unnamed protein product [Caenorhabditis auriculariae]